MLAATAPGHVDTVRRLVIDALSPEQLAQLTAIGQTIVRQVSNESAAPAA